MCGPNPSYLSVLLTLTIHRPFPVLMPVYNIYIPRTKATEEPEAKQETLSVPQQIPHMDLLQVSRFVMCGPNPWYFSDLRTFHRPPPVLVPVHPAHERGCGDRAKRGTGHYPARSDRLSSKPAVLLYFVAMVCHKIARAIHRRSSSSMSTTTVTFTMLPCYQQGKQSRGGSFGANVAIALQMFPAA